MLKSKHKLYPIWNAQKQRCNNPKNISYPRYGGRGIKLSEEFNQDFFVWLEYVTNLPNAMTDSFSIDRIDNDKGYEKGNLRWTSKTVQSSNTCCLSKRNASGYRGVYYDKDRDQWSSSIKVNNKTIRIGRYTTQKEAAAAYNQYVLDNNLPHTINIL